MSIFLKKAKSYFVIGLAVIFSSIALVNIVKSENEFINSIKFKFGLDLKGGSFMMLEVDENDLRESILAENLASIKGIFDEKKIVYSGIKLKENSIVFKIKNYSEASKVKDVLLKQRGIKYTSNIKGVFTVTIDPKVIDEYREDYTSKSITAIHARVNKLGVSEPNIYRLGKNRICIEFPGVTNIDELRSILGRTAKLTLHLVKKSASKKDMFTESGSKWLEDENGVFYLVESASLVSGGILKSASASYDDQNRPAIDLSFNDTGRKQFHKATLDNIGRQIAIVVDNEVLSAPTVQTAIPYGSATITGSMTILEAKRLALMMQSGSLPVKLNIVEERMISATLGKDSVKSGALATLLAIILIFIFIFIMYRRMSWSINISLLANLMMLLSFMSLIGITLTLSGIAAIAITLGMAVDANILIKEHIKEDIRSGMNLQEAIESGYKKASQTIFDSNLTTLVGAICLFVFASGSVRGFAVTFIVGILISIFTSVVLSKEITLRYFKNTAFDVVKKSFYSFDFIKNFKYFGLISLIVTMITAFSFYKNGIPLGIDFKGGHVLEFKADGDDEFISKEQNDLDDIDFSGIDFTQEANPSLDEEVNGDLGLDKNTSDLSASVEKTNNPVSTSTAEHIQSAENIITEDGNSSKKDDSVLNQQNSDSIKKDDAVLNQDENTSGGDLEVDLLDDTKKSDKGDECINESTEGSIELESKKNAHDKNKNNGLNVSGIRKYLASQKINGQVQLSGNTLIVKTEYIDDKEKLNQLQSEIQAMNPATKCVRFDSIGPKFSSEMAGNALLALLFAILAIFIYIWFRFKWQFSLCAILALVHDCIFILSLFSVFRFEFSETAIVAILMTISYSINDTIVVFDRIKNNLLSKKNHSDIINMSLNQTLSRTILTSVTTLIALFALYIVGDATVKNFVLPIIVGVSAGTYSSIFLAGPMVSFFKLTK